MNLNYESSEADAPVGLNKKEKEEIEKTLGGNWVKMHEGAEPTYKKELNEEQRRKMADYDKALGDYMQIAEKEFNENRAKQVSKQEIDKIREHAKEVFEAGYSHSPIQYKLAFMQTFAKLVLEEQMKAVAYNTMLYINNKADLDALVQQIG